MFDRSISVVIPVYCSVATLKELNTRLVKILSEFSSYEIIYVDDASPDDSFEIIKAMVQVNGSISGVRLDTNYGQQSALLCGIGLSSKDYVVLMDDDLEHLPEDIIRLYEEIEKGFDVVYALNNRPETNNLFRRLGSGLRDRTFNRLTDKPKDIKVCSFRIINRRVADEIGNTDTEFVYISMELLKHATDIKNIHVTYGTRGRSGHNLFKLVGLMLKLNVYYSKSRIFDKIKKYGKSYGIREIVGRESHYESDCSGRRILPAEHDKTSEK